MELLIDSQIDSQQEEQDIRPIENINTEIESLGTAKYSSPFNIDDFINDKRKILYRVVSSDVIDMVKRGEEPPSFERAGPRKELFFNPSETQAAIVSCGGLCPGINDVIRSLVMQLHYIYKIKKILGIRYGYQGFSPNTTHPPIALFPDQINYIHSQGGSFLGSSRGTFPIEKIVDQLVRWNIDILFTIGGDGTLRGSTQIVEEIKKRGLEISVIGIPKTIDNDVSYVAKSFGFETAFSAAVQAIQSAHAEAKGSPNGVGLVQLMGRHSGFIAANAALALKEVNYVLIPEMDFDLHGEKGLLKILEQRLKDRYHAVIVVAEGAGQKFFQEDMGEDASGNSKLGSIGLFLKDQINKHFRLIGTAINLKFIDPGYIIRSIPANPNDSVFCGLLAQNAVHAAMSGRTNMIIGVWNNLFVHLPTQLVISKRKRINNSGRLWHSIMESTGQPPLLNEPKL